MANSQTFSEQEANIYQQKVNFAADLQKRLLNGDITQARFETEMDFIRRTQLDNPSSAEWNDFLNEVAARAVALPGDIVDAAEAVADWAVVDPAKKIIGYAGKTAGDLASAAASAAGKAASNTAKSFFASLGVFGWVLIGAILFLGYIEFKKAKSL